MVAKAMVAMLPGWSRLGGTVKLSRLPGPNTVSPRLSCAASTARNTAMGAMGLEVLAMRNR